jgi:hypothetical protein
LAGHGSVVISQKYTHPSERLEMAVAKMGGTFVGSQSSVAGMAKLADAMALGAIGRKAVQVQVLFPAPNTNDSNNASDMTRQKQPQGITLGLRYSEHC